MNLFNDRAESGDGVYGVTGLRHVYLFRRLPRSQAFPVAIIADQRAGAGIDLSALSQ